MVLTHRGGVESYPSIKWQTMAHYRPARSPVLICPSIFFTGITDLIPILFRAKSCLGSLVPCLINLSHKHTTKTTTKTKPDKTKGSPLLFDPRLSSSPLSQSGQAALRSSKPPPPTKIDICGRSYGRPAAAMVQCSPFMALCLNFMLFHVLI